MPDYRRSYVPGGTYFLTLVTYRRAPLFGDERNVNRLRWAMRTVRSERPFDVPAAVVLPDHLHLIWALPRGDDAYSARVGRLKILVTRAIRDHLASPPQVCPSRRKHREGDVWHRRFWEHTIRDEDDFEHHLNYIHYNPVKHGLVSCPHLWPYSSFRRWVRNGLYDLRWGCSCDGRHSNVPALSDLAERAGE